MGDDSRAVVFGRDAAAYEAARPSYPESVIRQIESLVPAREAVEVGAGTGKATALLARDGLRLTCVEPSREMAAVLKARNLPGVDVVVSTFEEWRGIPSSIDLLFAAQAWHWVDSETSLAKTMSLLRPGGAIALFWNIPVDRCGGHEETYRRHAPHLLTDPDERIKRRDDHDWDVDMRRAGFVDVGRVTHRWSETLTAEQYRARYATYSDHIMLDEPTRSRLLDALEADVKGWGGTADLEYRCEVFTARKPVTDQH